MARLVILLYLCHAFFVAAENLLIQTEGNNKITLTRSNLIVRNTKRPSHNSNQKMMLKVFYQSVFKFWTPVTVLKRRWRNKGLITKAQKEVRICVTEGCNDVRLVQVLVWEDILVWEELEKEC